MSTISLRRVSRPIDIFRSYGVVLDGSLRYAITDGQKLDLTLDPGTHRIRIEVDRFRSPELAIHLNSERPLVLLCGHRSTPLSALYYLFRPSRYLFLEKVTTDDSPEDD
ncbi:MAG: hypothetical protein JST93_23090 [Acidobacteria bacterium]|nr:hypothetical protein [Acidobacteriota bacterium]